MLTGVLKRCCFDGQLKASLAVVEEVRCTVARATLDALKSKRVVFNLFWPMDHVSTKSIRWTTLLCWVPTPHEELVETAFLIGQRFHGRITEPLWSARNSRRTASRVTGLNHSNVCDEQLHGNFDGARLRSSEFAVSCEHCGIAHAHVTTPRTRHHSTRTSPLHASHRAVKRNLQYFRSNVQEQCSL